VASRRTWSLVALAVLAIAPAASPAEPARAATSDSLTVLTYNIHYGDPDRIADVIRSSGADVVALQEVDVHRERSGCVDQAQEIAAALGMTAVFGANYGSGTECKGAGEAFHGDALLSRFPIVDWRHTLLPNGGGEQRGLLEVVLDVDGHRIRACSTHFEYRSGSERKDQADTVATNLQASAEPVVVMGDLNGEPGDAALAPLRQAFTDAWEAAGDGDGYTNPSRAPRRRIDYVFFRGLSAATVDVLDSTASDHLAVRADLIL
jgi:endonuclease/exonuclease/phosphatase family metal-dependent hydrolase